MTLSTPYDELPYPSLPYAQSHPDRLATVAKLRGLEAAPVEGCRVLELGCAGGGNMVPMAYGLPGSQFVGIDYAARQIGEGQAMVAALGLTNVDLRCADILGLGTDLGEFDYIIAHGVLSWVPRPVQDKLLQLCSAHLAPRGVAYISYNTYPGWRFFGAVREMMLYHTRDITDLAERAREAWAFLEMLAQAVPTESGPYGAFLHAFTDFLRGSLQGPPGAAEALLLHDELEDVNEPLYFYQFVERASAHGLRYLGEAEFGAMVGGRLPPMAFDRIDRLATSVVELEQYADFLSNRSFRQTLLCHREIEPSPLIKPEQLRGFYLGSQAQPENTAPDLRGTSVVRFLGRNGTALSLDHPLSKGALVVLAEAWPAVMTFDTLLAKARARLVDGAESTRSGLDNALDAAIVGANLIKGYGLGGSLVELRVCAPRLTATVSERPLASAVARYQARRGHWATNLRHERVVLDEDDRLLLTLLDGLHDRDALVQGAMGGFEKQRVVPLDDDGKAWDRGVMRSKVDQRLAWLARAGLLEA